ncbi:MAG TPA: mycofactocin biosynthesis glycosyltransferase MftF [Acidimicrobiales bacterium]|nr:mycofactocin biosynthesis glycosyltransferase MftF [Acidimicrobiales bacterium]
MTAPPAGPALPAGWAITLDPQARRTDGGRTLIGGFPLRILRLTPTGARWLDSVAAGGAVPGTPGTRTLARRLTDGGLAVPHPTVSTQHTAADVALVIPVRDDAAGLRRALASRGEVGEVVVVDDGSQDPSAVEAAALAAGARLLRNDTPAGPGAARERGWRATQRPVVAFLDADVELPPDALAGLLAHLDDTTLAAVAPRVRARRGTAPGWLARYEEVRFPLDLGPLPGPVRPGSRVSYVPTAALLVRRAALEAVDGFDPALHLGEDVDLVWRLVAAGWSVRYEPEVVVHHPCRPDLLRALRQRLRYGTSTAPLAARHGRAGAPLGISGWSALAWGAVLLGHPGAGVGVAAGTTAALVPKLSGLDHPMAESLALAGRGHLWAGRAVADALRRPWWPLAAVVGWRCRRARPALVAAAVVPPLLEWREQRPALDPARFAVLRLLDDLAYGTGVWLGGLQARSLTALFPRFSGPIRR